MYNLSKMKATYFATLLLFALVACTKPNNEKKLADLKAKKADLEKNLEKLNVEIKALEKASGKVNVQQKTAFVQAEPLKTGTFQHFIEVQGKITSDNNVNINPKTSGEITKLYVHKGQAVKKGQLLASIDVSTLIKSREELKTSMEYVEQVYQKQKSLWDQKIGTEIQYLQAKNARDNMERRLATLNEQIAYGSVVSPANGVIEEVYPKEGESANPMMAMFRLVGNGDFKISADVSEAYSAKLKEGSEAEVFFPDLNKTIKTTVRVVGDEISALNRTFNIELYLPSSVPGAKANMIAYVRVKDYEKKNTLAIPVSVVQKSNEGTFVFVANENKATKRTVTTGQTYKGSAEVLSGLNKGDNLITAGYLDLIEGQPVKF
jgi:RND family efflux transporter MFP subunit